ncbi:hypothetical protein B0J13DRAFT_167291 [Dactylonectria estremocensis]|uniref:Polyketide cyclase/dehydrase n=1 Tax=Dactylonectria estremocensis TaxID=1079267 RepID=A0A9P9JEJ2_9HYPO|nr:hypothetical protein B0J13DRAFT_167291 [Dactylonectria estremocensis]
MYDIQASVTIAASPDQVWQKLMDLPSWSQWNTFVTSIQVQGPNQTLSTGSQQVITITPDVTKPTSTESYSNVVTEITPNQKLVWRGDLISPLVFSTEHWCTLEPVIGEDGTTESTVFTQGESFSGVIGVVVGFSGKPKQLKEGYVRMNTDLKKAVEGG